MSKEKDAIRKGKHLAFLLRHDQEAFSDGRIDRHGWRMVAEVQKLGYTRQMLDEIVATNDKQRCEYSPDGRRIRARQGHSIPVDVGLQEVTPPDVLYHGTATKFLPSIYKNGILPGSRLYVHLSPDKETAAKVGSRHGDPYVITIDCRKMLADGCKFWLSNNGVWLTKEVKPEYFNPYNVTEEQLKRVPSPDFWEMKERAKKFQASLPPYSREDYIREMKARGQYRTSDWMARKNKGE